MNSHLTPCAFHTLRNDVGPPAPCATCILAQSPTVDIIVDTEKYIHAFFYLSQSTTLHMNGFFMMCFLVEWQWSHVCEVSPKDYYRVHCTLSFSLFTPKVIFKSNNWKQPHTIWIQSRPSAKFDIWKTFLPSALFVQPKLHLLHLFWNIYSTHCGKYLDSTSTSLNNLIDSIEDLIVPNFVK